MHTNVWAAVCVSGLCAVNMWKCWITWTAMSECAVTLSGELCIV
jgi:hypothetical protein